MNTPTTKPIKTTTQHEQWCPYPVIQASRQDMNVVVTQRIKREAEREVACCTCSLGLVAGLCSVAPPPAAADGARPHTPCAWHDVSSNHLPLQLAVALTPGCNSTDSARPMGTTGACAKARGRPFSVPLPSQATRCTHSSTCCTRDTRTCTWAVNINQQCRCSWAAAAHLQPVKAHLSCTTPAVHKC